MCATLRRYPMVIKVLGTGCKKCNDLYEEAKKAIAETGVAAELVKVDKLEDIMKYSVFMTPAIVVDEVVKASGRVPGKAEIITWLAGK